ncbi:MAG TPA: peroxiredoxin family protein [Ignavibacteriaceae bacterium]
MVGEAAINFILKDQSGNDWELFKNLNQDVLMVFYPKDDTFVCSRQLKNYNDNLELFKSSGISPVGVNAGTAESHKAFCNKLELNFPLLADNNKDVSKIYNALNPFGSNKRRLVLINRQKQIAFEKDVFSLSFPAAKTIIKSFNQLNLIKLT